MEESPWVNGDADFLRLESAFIVDLHNTGPIEVLFKEYAHMFKCAGRKTAEHMAESADISKLDSYFFALVFLYRHCLELVMKAIAFQNIEDGASRECFIKETFHNLESIFEAIKPFIVQLDIYEDAPIAWLGNYLAGISEIDKESDSFRYPYSIHIQRDEWLNKIYSTKVIFEEQTHINLVAFVNKMETAYALLCSIYDKQPFEAKEYKDYSTEFLEEGGQYHGQCVVGYGYAVGKFYPFVKAYSEIPGILAEQITEDTTLIGTLFLPMCYLYRNAVELALKGILFEESLHSRQESLRLISKYKHKIVGLWQSIRDQVVEEANAPDEDKTIHYVDDYISQLHTYDPTSSIFRYPIDKHLAYHYKNKKQLDVKNVVQFFKELISFLEGVDMMLSVHNDIRAEIASEMSGYYDY